MPETHVHICLPSTKGIVNCFLKADGRPFTGVPARCPSAPAFSFPDNIGAYYTPKEIIDPVLGPGAFLNRVEP
jgi:hypothetical protein